MTRGLPDIDAIALYGSHVRGDFDSISDKDILLVDADINALSTASSLLQLRGYSCAIYTWERLRRLAARHGLFCQHLKQESKIIKDETGELATLLESYQPKKDYTTDIHATEQLVALTEYTSNDKASLGWAFDVLAVALRNLGILYLANCGQYEYSYHTILEKLRSIDVLKPADVFQLSKLRQLKALYRQRNFNALPSREQLLENQKVISKCFKIDLDSKSVSRESIIHLQLEKSAKHVNPYCRFRLIEGALATYFQECCDNKDIYYSEFMKIVRNQNHYGLYCRDMSIPLRSLAGRIINKKSDKRLISTNELSRAPGLLCDEKYSLEDAEPSLC